ncbi:MAG: hypothetical protein C0502_06985 [Opitutus sp.]|nr:hypothetical protein [Opitutus sp.]
MLNDLQNSLRTFVRNPILSLVIVVSLGIGIGANATIQAWIRGALLNPLPAVRAEVVALEARTSTGIYAGSSWLEYQDLAERLPSLPGVFAQRFAEVNLGEAPRGERVWVQLVSGNFFTALEPRPAAAGRYFQPDEASRPGGAAVAVISHRLWRTSYAGADDAIGRTLLLNNRSFTIIGVAAPEFIGGQPSFAFDVWVPAVMAGELFPTSKELTDRGARNYVIQAVVPPAASAARIRTELAAATAALAAAHPEAGADFSYKLVPLWQSSWGGSLLTGALGTLQVLTLLVLIVVCVNSASLLVSRASTRRREIGVRLALGAGPGAILRLLLAESLLLALAGSALGLLLAQWGVHALRHLPIPTGLPVQLSFRSDATGLLTVLGIGAVCGILSGLTPAWQLARADVQDSLRGGRGSVSGQGRIQQLLVGGEVAAATLVLVLAGLFLKSHRHVYTFDPGYAANQVMLASINLANSDYSDTARQDFLRDLLVRLQQHPNVATATAAGSVPFSLDGFFRLPVQIEGEAADPGRQTQAYFNYSAPGYFATMGVQLLSGADLAPLDRDNLPPDAVVNEEMARRCWPGVSPLGRRFTLNRVTYVVAGVARNSKYETMAETPKPLAWLTCRGRSLGRITLHLRVKSGDPEAILGDLRRIVWELDPDVPLLNPRAFTRHFDQNMLLSRIPARLLAVLGPLALALAAIGLYAVIACSLAQRTQEIGVRMALGSSPAQAVRLFLWQGMRVVLVGAAVGCVLALFAGHLLRGVLVGVPLGDPLVYGGVPLLLLAVAALACWLPARRAATVDPLVALRAE